MAFNFNFQRALTEHVFRCHQCVVGNHLYAVGHRTNDGIANDIFGIGR